MALGSMKLDVSYIAFWGDWKSMVVRDYREREWAAAETSERRV